MHKLIKILQETEAKIGLSEGFFESLLKEDDWSFVIKLHALIEALCVDSIIYHLKEPALKDVFSMVELGDKKKGKVVILRKLGLLNDVDCSTVIELSKIRNRYVHRASDVTKSLSDIYSEYDKNQRKMFLAAFPKEGALITLMMGQEHGFKELPKLEAGQFTKLATNEQPLYDLKLQIWSAFHTIFIHLNEMRSFSDSRTEEKADPNELYN